MSVHRLLLAALLFAAPARAASTAIRAGEHPGFGRLVFDLPPGATVEAVTEGDRTLLVFAGVTSVDAPPRAPRNVAAVRVEGMTATIAVRPGARVRQQRLGDRLVLDVLDPRGSSPPGSVGARKPTQAVAPATATPTPSPPRAAPIAQAATLPEAAPTVSVERAELPVQAAPTPASAPASGPIPAPASSPASSPASGPASAGAVPAAGPAAGPAPARPSVLLPADATVGAAAFRRDNAAVIVLDRRLTLSVPAIEGASVAQGQVSTTIVLPLLPGQAVRLGRVQAGWTVGVVDEASQPAASLPAPSQPGPAAAGLLFPQARPGRVVAVQDPGSGATLLVGTSLAAVPAALAGAERRTPDYAIASSWLGVAVEPLADRVDLRVAPAGFLLTGGAIAPPMPTAMAGRRFDLPDEPVPALLNRLRAQLATAATAPPRARSPARRAAAEAMIALGMGAEAQAIMEQLLAEDPQAAADAQVRALKAVAAVLAGRLDETDALEDASLADTNEMTLWRGIRDRRRGTTSTAAAALPGLAPLALAYPEPLRRLLRPDLAEAAAEAGIPLPDNQATPFAKALALERAGKTEEALAAWTALANSPDRLDATRASVRAVELNLAAGRLAPMDAADRLERQVFAWRGDGRELAVRMRVAELRAAAGRYRVALDALREADTLFPDQTAAITARKAAVFEGMLAAEGGKLSPLEVVLLAADYADCVPQGEAGAALAALLADKLMALDLPARAIPVLQGLVKSTTAGPARAEFGTRLAQLLLEGKDASGATAALEASAAPALPPLLVEKRAMLQARLQAAQGDTAGAGAALKAMDTANADELRATLLAAAGEWRGSLAALNDLAARTIPSEGALPEASQAIVIRQASAAARIPDITAMRTLAALLPRMTAPRRDLLHVLTEAPVTAATELPRASDELKLARRFPPRT